MMSEAIQKCNHQWLDFCEGSRCSRCGMVVNAIFYTKEDGVYTKDITPSPSPVAVSVEEEWSDIYARDLIRRLRSHASDGHHVLPGSIYYACNEAAAILTRLKDAPAAAKKLNLSIEDQRALNDALRISAPAVDEDLPFCSYCGATESDWNLGLLPATPPAIGAGDDYIEASIALCSMRPQPGTHSGDAWERGARQGYQWGREQAAPVAPPSPVEHAGLIERLLGPYPGSEAMKMAAAAIASLTEELRKLNDLYRETCRGVAAQVKRAEKAEAERDAAKRDTASKDWRIECQRSELRRQEADNAGFREALNIAVAERDRLMEGASKHELDIAIRDIIAEGRDAAIAALEVVEAERDAALAEVKRLREALTTDPTFSENARLFREATLAACDERLNEYKHRAREAEAEVKRFREALEAAEGELVNLLPHIPQACIPGHAGFIDAHVDEAISTIRTALAKTQEPK